MLTCIGSSPASLNLTRPDALASGPFVCSPRRHLSAFLSWKAGRSERFATAAILKPIGRWGVPLPCWTARFQGRLAGPPERNSALIGKGILGKDRPCSPVMAPSCPAAYVSAWSSRDGLLRLGSKSSDPEIEIVHVPSSREADRGPPQSRSPSSANLTSDYKAALRARFQSEKSKFSKKSGNGQSF